MDLDCSNLGNIPADELQKAASSTQELVRELARGGRQVQNVSKALTEAARGLTPIWSPDDTAKKSIEKMQQAVRMEAERVRESEERQRELVRQLTALSEAGRAQRAEAQRLREANAAAQRRQHRWELARWSVTTVIAVLLALHAFGLF